MIAATTRSGKKIFQSMLVAGGELSLMSTGFKIHDHFDAHCVFLYLAMVEIQEKGPTEFYQMYFRLAEMHLKVMKGWELPKELIQMYLDELTPSEKNLLGRRLVQQLPKQIKKEV